MKGRWWENTHRVWTPLNQNPNFTHQTVIVTFKTTWLNLPLILTKTALTPKTSSHRSTKCKTNTWRWDNFIKIRLLYVLLSLAFETWSSTICWRLFLNAGPDHLGSSPAEYDTVCSSLLFLYLVSDTVSLSLCSQSNLIMFQTMSWCVIRLMPKHTHTQKRKGKSSQPRPLSPLWRCGLWLWGKVCFF